LGPRNNKPFPVRLLHKQVLSDDTYRETTFVNDSNGGKCRVMHVSLKRG